jgi:dihydromethanopterin reductase (acceptor)
MYGLFSELSMISGGGYLQEIFLERKEGNSSHKTGRFMMGAFDLLIIAPATANTIAKMPKE